MLPAQGGTVKLPRERLPRLAHRAPCRLRFRRRRRIIPRMEINLLVVNVGNSRLAMAPFVAGEIGPVTRIPHDQRDQWERHLRQSWEQLRLRENAAIVAAGVNPPMEQALEDVVQSVANRRVVWVGKDLDLPIPVKTDQPEQTGVDRVLNVAAAYEQL